MILLSIIIPSYNSEPFICECLESCLVQDISCEDYEIILVDDYSTDHGIQKAQRFYTEYHAEKPILRVIKTSSTESKGASFARNCGLRIARGEYIWFIDSDDKIEKNSLFFLLTYINKLQLDILRFNFVFWENDKTRLAYILNQSNVLKGRQLYVLHPRPIGVWSAIWRKNFLFENSLFFLEGYMFEDEEFMPKAQYLASRTAILDKPYYYYRQRQGSVMSLKADSKKVLSYLAVCQSLYVFKKAKVEHEYQIVFDNIIAFLFMQAISLNSISDNPICLSVFKKQVYYPLKNAYGLKKWIVNHFLPLVNICLRIRRIFLNPCFGEKKLFFKKTYE